MYIIDYDKQLALISEMKQLRKDPQQYEVYYHHPYTNQMWKSFFPQANGQDLGPKLLRHEPQPGDIQEQLDICLCESVPENAIGLGIEWSAHPELWPSIIQALESRYWQYDRRQLKLFLDNLELDESQAMQSAAESNGKESPNVSAKLVDDLVWRSRKVRMKRFFVLG